MANKNKTRSSNDDDMDSNESSDEDGRCLPTTARPISTSLLLSNQQKIAEEKQSKNAEQSYINQQIHGYTRTHHDVLYRQNHHGVQLDHCVPSSNFASSQHYLPAEHFDCPRDERVRWMDDYKFSSTIDEYFIHFRESECIEDTQAHHMPPTIVLNTFSPNQITNGENNRINMDVITQNNPSQIVATLRLIHIPAEATVTGNAITKVPEEIPLVEALSNNAAIADVVLTSTSSNQMNNVDEQSARTELTNDTLSPETLEITRDVATNEVTPQAVLYVTDEPVTTVPKLPTALEQSDDSNKGIHIPTEATVTGNAITKVPEEIPQQSLIPDSFIYIEENDALTHGNNQIVVEALSNNAAIADVVLTSTLSNQMNNVDEQSARTKLTNDTLSPETLEITRDVATNEVTPQAVLCVTDVPVTTVPKLPTALKQSDNSNKGIRS
ncbi:unnamed protein product [Rotaria sp. Silwood1]|nr:unnamed protein product [Rotaria sp. Silwood1]